MFIKQLYTNCLSEAAYYIESEGEAVIIDPLRDIEAYIDLAKERNAGPRRSWRPQYSRLRRSMPWHATSKPMRFA